MSVTEFFPAWIFATELGIGEDVAYARINVGLQLARQQQVFLPVATIDIPEAYDVLALGINLEVEGVGVGIAYVGSLVTLCIWLGSHLL